ncbi:hypothetical protein [Caballeronia sp. KNU42]
MRLVISRRPAFYWIHIYRRIAPALIAELGARTDPTTLLEVRSHVEQSIYKYGSLSKTEGISLSNSIEFSEILGGMLNEVFCEKFSQKQISQYKEHFQTHFQWVLTDFSEIDVTDVYHLEGFTYQYWYITTGLLSCGIGGRIKRAENGDLLEERTEAKNTLITAFDACGERASMRDGFGTNVGTFVRSHDIKKDGAIFSAAPNVGQYNAKLLRITGVDPRFSPNYLPFIFNAEEFYEAHLYLSPYFETKMDIGLLEYC